ncbi:helix-turn-helix transcriptional regulator [Natrialbaceae archaeon GCM10025810]|uniref:helix-turn-helix transcriptional regulator n=1 Tax=Halovalidus salilacus TaxID=3075124 RepID=UPI00361AEA57
MLSSDNHSPLDDIAFLARSERRVVALDALAEGPRSGADLRAITDASSSTVRRLLREFEDRYWIRRDGNRYEATPLGAYVAAGMRDLLERFDTERTLRGVWRWLPTDACGFLVEVDPESDLVVTVAEAADPYRPVNRFVSLLRESSRFRFVGFDLALLEPCKDELARRIVDGMRTEIVDPPSVARYVLATYPDHCTGPLESGNLAVWVHDDLPPYGVCVFDERIAISGYHRDSGTVRVLIDTDDPRAREWAESTFETYRREARSFPLGPLAE